MNEFLNDRLFQLVEEGQGIVFPYSDKWVESHAALAAKMWPHKLRRRNEAYIRWKFRGPSKGEVPGFLVAVLEDRVVGQLGLIPVKMWIDGQIVDAQWACDLMVDSDIRQKGIGSLLLAKGMFRDMVTLGSNPSKLADLSMTKLGFKSLIGPRSMVLPLKSNYALELLIKKRVSMGGFSSILQPLLDLRNKFYKAHSHSKVDRVLIDQVISLIENRQKKIKVPYIIHDKDFFDWRLSSVLPADIRVWLSEYDAFAVTEPTPRTYYIYDWQASSKLETKALFGKLTADALNEGCASLTAYANTSEEEDYLKGIGFVSMRTPVKVIYYPEKAIDSGTSTFHYSIYDSDGNL